MSGAQYFSDRYMPLDPDVPEEDRRQADEFGQDYDRRRRDAWEALGHQLEEVANRAKYQVRELLGAENWIALRRRMRDERRTFRDLLQPPANASADYDKLNAARRGNLEKFLYGLDVSPRRIRDIYREFAAGTNELLPVTDAKPGVAAWLHPEQLAQVTRDTGTTDDVHAWTTFRPPYDGWQQGWDSWSSGAFSVARTHFTDPNTGLVGSDLTLTNTDASDFDNGWGIADSQLSFWYLPPATGLVEVIIEARCGRGLHQVRLDDEFGTSDSGTSHWNYLMAHVLHPNVNGPSFAWMSHYVWETDNSGFDEKEFLTPGGVYSPQLFSSGPVPANQWVEIRAGTREQDGSITNDMEVRSLSLFRWSMGNVYVRIAP